MGTANSKTFTPLRLDGKTVIVTGCNTGIGLEIVKTVYEQGARVLLACRDTRKAQEAADGIKSEFDANEAKNVGEMVVKQLNLASLQSVRDCAEDINKTENQVHYLINNAGIMACPKGKTEDGFEIQFGTNHLGHFLLTGLLIPKLIQSAPSRIINISSHWHGDLCIEDPNFRDRPYSPWKAYTQSKLANILFTVSLADKLKESGVTAYSLHPGVVKTEIRRHMNDSVFPGVRQMLQFVLYPFFKTPKEGAETALYCIFKKDESDSGGYFSGCALSNKFRDEDSLKIAEQLWNISCEMVKLPQSWNL